jgi:hypothetical protein
MLWLSSPRACSLLYEAMSYVKRCIVKLCHIGGGIPAYIGKKNHIDCQNRQLLNGWVANCLVRKVQTRLEDCKTWLRANCPPSVFQVFLDTANVVVGAVYSLLYDCLCVSGEALDKAFL